MIQQNLGEILQVIEVVAPARKTATANGSGIDIRDYVGDLKVVLSSSAGGGTAPTLDVKLQDSDSSGGTYADISGAAFTQVTGAAASTQSLTIDADAVKQFIRAVITIAGTSPTFDMALVAVGVKQVR